MKKVLILGANGGTARIVVQRLLSETDDELVLFLRDAKRLSEYDAEPRIELVEGDALNPSDLTNAMQGIDIVYSNLGGTNLAEMARAAVTAMQQSGVSRLIFYSALGALHEVPGKFGEWNEGAISAYLPGFRESDEILRTTTTINTTQIRPAWLTDSSEVDYELTGATEAFKGTEVSRASVADFVVSLIKDPSQYPNDSIGIDKPGTEGDKPAFV